MSDREEKFYLKLRKSITKWLNDNANINHRWREYLMIVPDIFYLLIKLVQDPEVPQSKKIKLISAIAYFISPIDLLPEAFMGPLGYLDDLGLAAYVLNDLINFVDPQVIKRHWVGDIDVLYLIKKILVNIDNIIGKVICERLKIKIK
jgi:uncharacterized membrane protein YkvA (DUF1232 family)